jgi:DNA N-6-adenine-methyltransferase (Dam)
VVNAPIPLRQTLFPAPQEQMTKDDYYTPKAVFDDLGLQFDLDVCAPPGGVPWIPAHRFLTVEDDGLAQPWEGRVWMNPPYSQATAWVHRFIEHHHGIALVGHAKSAWHPVLWAQADAVAFPFSYFDFVGGSIMLPVWFAAFGEECAKALSPRRRSPVQSRGSSMTTIQRSIFDQPKARATDPSTSHAAANDARPRAERHRDLALRILRDHPEGLDDFSLAELANVPQTSIGVRRNELVKMGLVENTGRKTDSPHGSRCIVWACTQDRRQLPASPRAGCAPPAPDASSRGASGPAPFAK